MLSKAQITPLYKNTILVKGKEPFFNWLSSLITIQVQNGRSTHILVMQEPFTFRFLAPGDELEIYIVQKRTIKTWLGRLWNKLFR